MFIFYFFFCFFTVSFECLLVFALSSNQPTDSLHLIYTFPGPAEAGGVPRRAPMGILKTGRAGVVFPKKALTARVCRCSSASFSSRVCCEVARSSRCALTLACSSRSFTYRCSKEWIMASTSGGISEAILSGPMRSYRIGSREKLATHSDLGRGAIRLELEL